MRNLMILTRKGDLHHEEYIDSFIVFWVILDLDLFIILNDRKEAKNT